MASITKICQNAKQPHGGYLPLKNFKKITYDFLPYDGSEEYNISPNIFGNAIDYGSRIFFDDNIFDICLQAANAIGPKVHRRLNKEIKKLNKYLDKNNEYNKEAVILLCNIVYFDIVYRSGQYSEEDLFTCDPDDTTVFLINLYIQRTLEFFKEVGPVCATGFTFEDAFTHLFTSGDGDFLTKNTIWDIKALKANPNAQQTLQVACYYVAAKHSKKEIYKNINSFGIFNPRKNTAWILNEEEVNSDVLSIVANQFMGYELHGQEGSNNDISMVRERYKHCQYYEDIAQSILYITSYSDFDPTRFKDRKYLISINMGFILDGKEIAECFKYAKADLSKAFNPGYISSVIDVRHRFYEKMAQKEDDEAEKFLRVTISLAMSYITLACIDQEDNFKMASDLYNAMVRQKEKFLMEKKASIDS